MSDTLTVVMIQPRQFISWLILLQNSTLGLSTIIVSQSTGSSKRFFRVSLTWLASVSYGELDGVSQYGPVSSSPDWRQNSLILKTSFKSQVVDTVLA